MPPDTRLLEILERHRYVQRRGAFYGSSTGLPLGSGSILKNCRIPFYDAETNGYRNARGYAYVLTHECDIDPTNQRAFNDKLLVLPIIDFRVWYLMAEETFGEDVASKIATDVVADQIYRVFFLPTVPNSSLEYGGVLYFNEITNTEVSDLQNHAEQICSLTSYSHRILSFKLENHLLRPKSAPLMTIN